MKKLLSLALLFINSIAFSQITLTESHTAPTCYGLSNGSATITASGGTAPYSYTLVATQNTTGVFTGLSSGTQTVVVEDANSLTSSISITIPVTQQINTSLTSIPAKCYGTSTGTINITGVSGGNPAFLYSLNGAAYQSSTTFANVPAGVYVVSTKDANNCTVSNTVQVNQPTQLNVAISGQNAHCNAANGIASTTVTGGTGLFTYSWIPSGGFAATSNGLTPGNYTVIVTDANNCIESNSITISSIPGGTGTVIATTNVTCNGLCDGSIQVGNIGGNAPFTYSWSGTPQNLSTATWLCAGTYSCTITDFYGCSSTVSATITQPAPMSATVTHTNVSCFGLCDAQVQISNVTGGVAPYTYYTMSSSPQSNPLINGLCAGTYTVYTKDANNCEYAMAATITQPTQIMATTTSTNANCGQSNGAICLNVSGGSGVYNTMWSNGPTTFCNTNISGGAYTYTVIDLNGCSIEATKIVSSISGPTVTIANQTNVSCFNGTNGSVIASASGGTTPYIYSWSPSSISSPTLSNVPSGIYNVMVTDVAGCIGTQSVVITQPSQLLVYAYSQPECGGGMCNGSINATVNGGTAPYTYAWSNGVTTGNYLPGLCAGMYSVQVTDAMGCVGTQTAFVNQTTPINITMNYTNVTCNSSCNGSAYPSIIGGAGVATYIWLPTLQTSPYANNLCAGNYTLQVTDLNGCVTSNTVAITNTGVGAMPNATLSTSAIKETCLNSYDGSIDLTITGTNPGPFTYQWNNGATSQDVYNLNSNIYSVTVFDAAMNCLTIQDTVTADGTNCGVITGKVFIDNNTDCINNSGDIDFNSALIVVNPGNRYGYTNATGNYTVANLPYGNYSTSLVYANGILIPTPTCSTTINTTVSSGMQISNNNDFSVGYNSITQPDMQVWGYSSPIVPGFVAHLTYQLSNLNNVNGTGLFKVVLPYNFITNITAASPNTYSISADTLIWNFNNITYSSGGIYFGVDFYVPVGTTLGSVFSTCTYAQPNITDLNYANNNYCYSHNVTGSFDPNDKTVNPVGVGATGDIPYITTDLTYLIRFQNTGNGPAVNIVVKDTLSPNVDVTTFEMLGSSHNYNIEIVPGNILKWKFNNIMLPDSNSNEPASHGYIQYRVKRNPVYEPGTQIKNTAYIYFDFNEPVVTNTAINTIAYVTDIKSSSSINDGWNVYPNPSTGALYIVNASSSKETSQVQVLNAIGQIVLEETITSNYKNMDLSKLNNGVYFIKINSENSSIVKRVVLRK